MNHKSRQLVSVQALHNASFEELLEWNEEYLGDVQLLLDERSQVFDEYKINHYRPQFLVLDRDMSIAYKGYLTEGKQQAEDTVLSLLEN